MLKVLEYKDGTSFGQTFYSRKGGHKIVEVVRANEERAKKCGEDIWAISPISANIAGGISNLKEKPLVRLLKLEVQLLRAFSVMPKGGRNEAFTLLTTR